MVADHKAIRPVAAFRPMALQLRLQRLRHDQPDRANQGANNVDSVCHSSHVGEHTPAPLQSPLAHVHFFRFRRPSAVGAGPVKHLIT